MIAFIKGILAQTRPGIVVLEAGGLGYEINVPSGVFGSLPGIGETVLLHTYLQVKEDGVSLFGFLKKDDLDMFRMLITVNGIGPKAALSIPSAATADQLRFAVLAEDMKAIEKIPGIGKKTAGKLILELKDKLRLEDAFEQKLVSDQEETGAGGMGESAREAVEALDVRSRRQRGFQRAAQTGGGPLRMRGTEDQQRPLFFTGGFVPRNSRTQADHRSFGRCGGGTAPDG